MLVGYEDRRGCSWDVSSMLIMSHLWTNQVAALSTSLICCSMEVDITTTA